MRTTSHLRGGRLLDARHNEALPETLDGLRHEVDELRASRERLVLAADADRRGIERALHEGVHQHLIALAVSLQLVEPLADNDPAAKALVGDMRRAVQEALDETARLAQHIYPPLLDGGGIAAAVRSAASSVGVRTTVNLPSRVKYPPEITAAIYWCCLGAFEHADTRAQATVTAREDDGAVVFEIVEDGALPEAGLERLVDRVEALGGRLTVEQVPGRGIRVAGSLPLSSSD